MIMFSVNSGMVEIQDSLGKLLMNKTLILRSYNETISCDSGMCEVVHGISMKIKKHCNDSEMLYFINGNVEIAMDAEVYNILGKENIYIKKERDLSLERKPHR
jgi:hypothetical protein